MSYNDGKFCPHGFEISRNEYDNLKNLTKHAKALCDKLELMNENKSFQGVWIFLYNHGCEYNGPTYEKEFKDLKKALEQCK